jgi:hypothetical protein
MSAHNEPTKLSGRDNWPKSVHEEARGVIAEVYAKYVATGVTTGVTTGGFDVDILLPVSLFEDVLSDQEVDAIRMSVIADVQASIAMKLRVVQELIAFYESKAQELSVDSRVMAFVQDKLSQLHQIAGQTETRLFICEKLASKPVDDRSSQGGS